MCLGGVLGGGGGGGRGMLFSFILIHKWKLFSLGKDQGFKKKVFANQVGPDIFHSGVKSIGGQRPQVFPF